ncbi:unnamed protein product [Arctia plantaginis]|uniref:Uncharacterized protein n=1 Tax=Arctia plantaginis TaxID=874455 RepID=A0A8S1AD01_ARCPL|nr:unnamed protein product [Arctia plantaginis]
MDASGECAWRMRCCCLYTRYPFTAQPMRLQSDALVEVNIQTGRLARVLDDLDEILESNLIYETLKCVRIYSMRGRIARATCRLARPVGVSGGCECARVRLWYTPATAQASPALTLSSVEVALTSQFRSSTVPPRSVVHSTAAVAAQPLKLVSVLVHAVTPAGGHR